MSVDEIVLLSDETPIVELDELRPAQIDPETLRFDFHNGSSTSI